MPEGPVTVSDPPILNGGCATGRAVNGVLLDQTACTVCTTGTVAIVVAVAVVVTVAVAVAVAAAVAGGQCPPLLLLRLFLLRVLPPAPAPAPSYSPLLADSPKAWRRFCFWWHDSAAEGVR